jgi:hypothetical protein
MGGFISFQRKYMNVSLEKETVCRAAKKPFSAGKQGVKIRKPAHSSSVKNVRVFINGGAGRDRTDDPQTASLMLSQLSYSPNILSGFKLLHGITIGQWICRVIKKSKTQSNSKSK